VLAQLAQPLEFLNKAEILHESVMNSADRHLEPDDHLLKYMVGYQLDDDETNLYIGKWLEITKHPSIYCKNWLFRVPFTVFFPW